MKKTKLVRKTPLKRGGALKSKVGLKSHTLLKNKSELKRSKPLQGGTERRPVNQGPRNSMYGKGRSAADIVIHSELVSAGCIACHLTALDPQHPLQIHHPEGRNKGKVGDVSEQIAMCLCAGHHDQRAYRGFWRGDNFMPVDPDMPSIHHAKKAFVAAFGSELRLVHESYRLIGRRPAWLLEAEWLQYLELDDRDSQEDFIARFSAQCKAIRAVA